MVNMLGDGNVIASLSAMNGGHTKYGFALKASDRFHASAGIRWNASKIKLGQAEATASRDAVAFSAVGGVNDRCAAAKNHDCNVDRGCRVEQSANQQESTLCRRKKGGGNSSSIVSPVSATTSAATTDPEDDSGTVTTGSTTAALVASASGTDNSSVLTRDCRGDAGGEMDGDGTVDDEVLNWCRHTDNKTTVQYAASL